MNRFPSHDAVSNNKNNFFIKIRKMETKLNIWLSRDLTLFGRTMLAKSLGLSQLVYAASMLSVPEAASQKFNKNFWRRAISEVLEITSSANVL